VSTDTFKGWPRIRVSIQAYNTADDVQRLLDALAVLVGSSCA